MTEFSIFTSQIPIPVSQVVYVKGVEAAPIPGPQGPPGTPVSVHDLLLITFFKCGLQSNTSNTAFPAVLCARNNIGINSFYTQNNPPTC